MVWETTLSFCESQTLIATSTRQPSTYRNKQSISIADATCRHDNVRKEANRCHNITVHHIIAALDWPNSIQHLTIVNKCNTIAGCFSNGFEWCSTFHLMPTKHTHTMLEWIACAAALALCQMDIFFCLQCTRGVQQCNIALYYCMAMHHQRIASYCMALVQQCTHTHTHTLTNKHVSFLFNTLWQQGMMWLKWTWTCCNKTLFHSNICRINKCHMLLPFMVGQHSVMFIFIVRCYVCDFGSKST